MSQSSAMAGSHPRPSTSSSTSPQFLAALPIVPLTEEIACAGGLFRRDYGPTHGTGLVDGLVVATANAVGARLATLHGRHYPMPEDVLVPY